MRTQARTQARAHTHKACSSTVCLGSVSKGTPIGSSWGGPGLFTLSPLRLLRAWEGGWDLRLGITTRMWSVIPECRTLYQTPAKLPKILQLQANLS